MTIKLTVDYFNQSKTISFNIDDYDKIKVEKYITELFNNTFKLNSNFKLKIEL